MTSPGGRAAKVIPVGPKELAIEFPTSEDMEAFLARKVNKDFVSTEAAENISVPKLHHLWLQISNVSLGAWDEPFFISIAGLFGEVHRLDRDMKERNRYDLTKVLISSSSTYIQGKRVDVFLDRKIVTVNVDAELCPDWV